MKNTKLSFWRFGELSVFLFALLFFSSCQSFQADESTMRLHDIWGLQQLNGKQIDSRTQGAILELYVAKQSFLLSANQKSFQGKFRAGKSQISFSKITPALSTTSLAQETELIDALKKAKRWEFEKRHLILYGKEKVLARFVKMD